LLKETLLDEAVDPTVPDTWRASLVGEECETYLCRMRLGHQPLPMKGRVRHLLDDGNMHEDDVVNRLKNGGLDVLYTGDEQLYVHCVSQDGIVVNGHPDGVLRNVPKDLQKLDWADETFSWDSVYHLLEITAPNNFAFKRYYQEHLRGVNYRKFVQTHLYLGSEELRDRMRCSVVIVKDKMTSTLYEEGLTYDQSVIDTTIEKLKRVNALVAARKVSTQRCVDWHRKSCRFRELCFGSEEEEIPLGVGFLDADKLLEAVQLHEALDSYSKGKEFEVEGKELVEEARAYFGEILDQYGAEGMFIVQTKVKWTNSKWSGIDSDTLRLKYPEVYNEVHLEKPTHFISVLRTRQKE